MSIVSIVETFLLELGISQKTGGETAQQRPLIVAVSGGPDSVALLHLLARAIPYLRGKIVVAHLNHMIRPGATDEASFVASLAQDWQLPFRTRAVEVKTLARREGLSLEAAARQARYDFLANVAREFGAIHIATGHNQNDQAETVLMHFIRGSGLAGLRGMQPVSPLPGAPDLTLLRPLLTVSRSTIQAYLAAHGLKSVEDESNADVVLLRNRLRHQLLPALIEYNPQIVARLDSLARVVDADEALLAQTLDARWGDLVQSESKTRLALDLTLWRAQPLSLRRRSLRRAALALRPDLTEVSFEVTEMARQVAEQGQTGDQATLPGQVTLTVAYDVLVLATPEHRPAAGSWPQLPGDSALRLAVPGAVQLVGSWTVRAERVGEVDFERIAGNQDRWRVFVDAAFADGLVVRARRTGERMQPLGMGGQATKVGDIMTNRKIPGRARSRWPILASEDHPLWLVGHVVDERARLRPGDGQVLLVWVERPKSVD